MIVKHYKSFDQFINMAYTNTVDEIFIEQGNRTEDAEEVVRVQTLVGGVICECVLTGHPGQSGLFGSTYGALENKFKTVVDIIEGHISVESA